MGTSEKEIEINIISLFFYLLRHWRSILLTSFAALLLFVPIGMHKIIKSESTITSTQEITDSETSSDNSESTIEINDIFEETILSPVAIDEVNNCYSSIKNYQDLKNYYSNSPYMLIDFNAAPHATAIIDISVADDDNITNILNVYKNLIEDISFHEYACEYIGNSIYSWDYLVSFNEEVSDTNDRSIVKISILYPDDDTCIKLLDSAIDFIYESKDAISEIYGEYTINVISRKSEVAYSKNVETIQNSSEGLLNQTYTDIVQRIQVFSRPQLDYLTELLKSDQNTDKDIMDLLSDTLQIIDAQKSSEISAEADSSVKDNDDAASEEAGSESTEDSEASKKKQFIKNLLIGLFMGFFASSLFHAMTFILTNRTDYADNLTELYGIAHFGNIVRNNPSVTPIDSLIYRLQHFHKSIDETNDISICATDIVFSMQEDKIANPAIISCKSEFEDSDLLNKLADKLSELGKNTSIIQNVLNHPDSFSSIVEADSVIIAGMSDKTFRYDIIRLIDILNRHNIKILGGIIIE